MEITVPRMWKTLWRTGAAAVCAVRPRRLSTGRDCSYPPLSTSFSPGQTPPERPVRHLSTSCTAPMTTTTVNIFDDEQPTFDRCELVGMSEAGA